MLATEDRIRTILEVRAEALLPRVNAAALHTYFRYLSSRLILPCEARHASDSDGALFPVTVTGLVDPQTMPSDHHTGLRCIANHGHEADIVPLVDIEVEHDSPNFQILEDYWFWLWNWRENHSHRRCKPR